MNFGVFPEQECERRRELELKPTRLSIGAWERREQQIIIRQQLSLASATVILAGDQNLSIGGTDGIKLSRSGPAVNGSTI